MIISALDYIDSHIDINPSLTDTAHFVGLAPSYFSRLFKQITGSTYSEYLSLYRLLIARTLIMQTALSLNEIALTTGFCNGNYLSTLFREHFQMTPTAYKKKYAGCDQFPDE